MTEQCFLVKDVGDIVTMTEFGQDELIIVAMDGDLAWVRYVKHPRSMGMIVNVDRLAFVRSTVAQDFEPALDHAVDPFEVVFPFSNMPFKPHVGAYKYSPIPLFCGDGVVGD